MRTRIFHAWLVAFSTDCSKVPGTLCGRMDLAWRLLPIGHMDLLVSGMMLQFFPARE